MALLQGSRVILRSPNPDQFIYLILPKNHFLVKIWPDVVANLAYERLWDLNFDKLRFDNG